tara:strand:- start:559 stop:708 length:150 start_codon:yes stop_codon:yes gene_type:complete
MSEEELIAKVKELEENQMKLLESLPLIIKNVIIKHIQKENNFIEIKDNE